MQLNLNLRSELEETIAPQKDDFLGALSLATEQVLTHIVPPLPVGISDPGEPNWDDTESIKEYIDALRSQGNDIGKSLGKAKSTLPDLEYVNKTVRELLDQALIMINRKRQELSLSVKKIEDQAWENRERTRLANERLEELWAQRENLERLAALESTVKNLCENFPAWHKARHYQVDGILAAVSAYMTGKSGFLDADDMGLGKTFKSTIMMFIVRALFLNEHGREPRMIWVTKKSLIKSNMNEIHKWYPEHQIIPMLPDYAKTPKDRRDIFGIAEAIGAMFLCSYEHVRTTDEIRYYHWDIVFADEVHKLKGGCNSSPTEIWVTMKEMCRQARFMYFLSGTPIVNKAEEMWSYLHIFAPEMFPTVKNFLHRFTDANYDGNDVKFTVNVNRLMNALEGQMIHRTKFEVGEELPDADAPFIYLTMEGEQLRYYQQMRDNFFVMLDKAGESKMLAATVIIAHINRLRQIALCPQSLRFEDKETGEVYTMPDDVNSVKLDQAMDLIEQLNGEQVVVFSSQFNAPLEELAKRLTAIGKSHRIIDGQHTNFVSEYEQDFQQGKFDVLMINMRTGTEGLNLHKCEDWPGGASYAIMLDLWWAPAINDQAMNRLHRIGTREPVTIYVLQCEDSADQYVKAILDEKDGLINPIMGDSRLRPASEWRELLEGLV